ncbi:hypothetical protein [Aestuariivirga litoralis]|uniref:hypothetical protein n=1 Tax=Aestuariivirga litoralis TaxID=2650924 RepID=UPI0018C62035|nr:hypothetical protein [Aestuariivirga litoralis]MBG1232970.1 hypothetical protein [Aestuariivirga litoralis]
MKSLGWMIDQLLRGPTMRVALLVELTLPAGTDRLWSGAGSLVWNGNTFKGLGRLGRVSGAGETAEIRTTETTYAMSGIVDIEGINNYINSPIRGGIAKCWLAFLNDDETIIPDPVLIDITELDTAGLTFAEDGTATLALRGTSAIFNFKKPRGRYVSNEQQQADYPGDTGMDRVPGLASRTVSWTRT